MASTYALHNAARDGDVTALANLIAQGGDLSQRDKHARTALHLAAWAGQTDVVKLLLAHGIQVNAAAADDMNALHFAAQKGHTEPVRYLLNAGLHVDCRTRKGMTPLMMAAQNGHQATVELLLKRKASPLATNKKQESALQLAKAEDIKALVQTAIEEGKAAKARQASAPTGSAAEPLGSACVDDQQGTTQLAPSLFRKRNRGSSNADVAAAPPGEAATHQPSFSAADKSASAAGGARTADGVAQANDEVAADTTGKLGTLDANQEVAAIGPALPPPSALVADSGTRGATSEVSRGPRSGTVIGPATGPPPKDGQPGEEVPTAEKTTATVDLCAPKGVERPPAPAAKKPKIIPRHMLSHLEEDE